MATAAFSLRLLSSDATYVRQKKLIGAVPYHGGINTAYPNEFKFTLIQGQSELKFVVWKNIRTNFDYNDFMGSGRVQLRNVDVSKGYEEYCCFLQKGINRDVTGELRLVLKCTHAHSKKYDPSSSSAKSAPQGYPQHPHSSRNFSEDPISAPSWTPRCHHPAPYPPPPSYCPLPPVNYQAPYQPPPPPPPPVNYQPPYQPPPPPPVNYQPPYQPPPPAPVNYQPPYQPPPPPPVYYQPTYQPPPPVNYQAPYQPPPPPPPPVYYQPPYQPPPPLHYPSQYTVQPPPSTPPPLSQLISVIHLLASVASIEANLSQFFES